MTMDNDKRTGNKAIIEWLFDNYSCNPKFIAEQNALKEARSSSAIIELANSNNATLLRCRVTGQPVGQLFDHVTDVIIPATVAPTWVVMPRNTEERLAKTPLATTIYLITRVLTGQRLCEYLRTTGFTTVQQIDAEVGFLASVYDALVASPKVAPVLFVAINDLIKRFGVTDTTCKAVFQTALVIESSRRIEEILTPIADVWEKMIEDNTGKAVNSTDDILKVEQLVQKTIHSISRPAEINTTLSNLLMKPSPVKKSAVKRADVTVHREINNELSAGIAALFANAKKQKK